MKVSAVQNNMHGQQSFKIYFFVCSQKKASQMMTEFAFLCEL